jgi:ribosome-binding factor A
MSDRKTERIARAIQMVASETILFRLKDPRVSFMTITKVKVTEDLRYATIYYSVLGDKADRTKTEHMLAQARPFVQSAVAGALRTRVTPSISFEFDPSVEGSIRVSHLIDQARAEDEERRKERGDPPA